MVRVLQPARRSQTKQEAPSGHSGRPRRLGVNKERNGRAGLSASLCVEFDKYESCLSCTTLDAGSGSGNRCRMLLGTLRGADGAEIEITITSAITVNLTGDWLYFAGTVSLGDSGQLLMRGDRTFALSVAGIDYEAVIEDPPAGSTIPAVGPVVVGGRFRPTSASTLT